MDIWCRSSVEVFVFFCTMSDTRCPSSLLFWDLYEKLKTVPIERGSHALDSVGVFDPSYKPYSRVLQDSHLSHSPELSVSCMSRAILGRLSVVLYMTFDIQSPFTRPRLYISTTRAKVRVYRSKQTY